MAVKVELSSGKKVVFEISTSEFLILFHYTIIGKEKDNKSATSK